MKIQNTKDYGLSGKVDCVKYIFYAATILNVIQQIKNKNKEVYTTSGVLKLSKSNKCCICGNIFEVYSPTICRNR